MIVEFLDYRCGFCRELWPELRTINARYAEDVSVVYRHYPMAYHSGSFQAALAAECASALGRFAPFHNVLFANQWALSDSTEWRLLAQLAGIAELDRFDECLARGHSASKVVSDTTLAHELEFDGVPTMVINGAVYGGVFTSDQLEQIVQDALLSSEAGGKQPAR